MYIFGIFGIWIFKDILILNEWVCLLVYVKLCYIKYSLLVNVSFWIFCFWFIYRVVVKISGSV